MKVASLTIIYNKKTKKRLQERGMFSDDPQWLFNLHMVFGSGRSMEFRGPRHDEESLLQIEGFLVQEEIPYARTVFVSK
jgi:hypothetical protein